MKVEVKLFGVLRSCVPGYDPEKGVVLEMQDRSTYADLLATLGLFQGEGLLFLAKGISRNRSDLLDDATEVQIFTPIGGG